LEEGLALDVEDGHGGRAGVAAAIGGEGGWSFAFG